MSPLIPIFPKTKLQMTKTSMKIKIIPQKISSLSKFRKMRKKLVFIKLDYSRRNLKIATSIKTIIIITIVIARKAKRKRKVENKY